MSYSVIPTEIFKKEAKRLIKKYQSVKNELQELSSILQDNPTTGISLGKSTYKIRIAIKSKGSGKSGGARVITYVVTAQKEVYLLTIYNKADLDSVDDITLQKIIKNIVSEN